MGDSQHPVTRRSLLLAAAGLAAPFDEDLKPKPALTALRGALPGAAPRILHWRPPRC